MKTKWMWVGAGLALGLAGCGGVASPAADEGVASSGVVSTDPRAEGDAASPYARAARALAEGRMVSPGGDNAVEHYLAARAQVTERARADTALAELQPYVVIAAEQAIARGDPAEAQRLQDLIERIDAQAPALPRLRTDIATLAREQAARAAAAVLETPPPAVPDSAPPARMTPAPAVATEVSVRAIVPAAPVASIEVAPPPVADAQPEADPVPAPGRAVAAARAPRLLQDAQPRYPLPALRARIEGQAEVAFTIQPDGSVRDVRLLSSTPSGMFDASALAVAQRWRFEATGQAHASSRTVRFRLPASEARDG